MITTYGVGAMVAIGDQSYVISGLDTWNLDTSITIHEPRLERRLGVDGFRLPPAASSSTGDGVRVRLFPEFYSCPGCHELKEFHKFGSPPGTSRCGACDKLLTPSRFVIACENGHLDDFPYAKWVHKGADPGRGHRLTLHSTGRTASLRSVIIRCSCGEEASMEGAFSRNALRSLNIFCEGRRPWLGRGAEQSGCKAIPRTLQRGSSAVWFPIVRSALSIPPWSETLQKRLNCSQYPMLKSSVRLWREGRVSYESLEELIRASGILDASRFTPKDVIEAVQLRVQLEESEVADSDGREPLEAAGELRREEYERLLFGTASVDREDDFECTRPPEDPDTPLPVGIERSMQVKRLREVRALWSFTRVEAPDSTTPETRRAALSIEDKGWLPAVEVIGEGVFLTLDTARLGEWERQKGVRQRADRIRDNHTAALRRRIMATNPKAVREIQSPISARYILLHTLAHALINEWSLESGYPAASLRERLYVSHDMAGLLIYTATSDSAGSLGGVVAQGEYKNLRNSLESALRRVSWCSQDPPCMESEAGGVDSLNLAACYACVLLPETSCETNNTFLDRAMLIGTPDESSVGYFALDE
ncbi:DUF1998 domain-containing protein [Thermomonospora catenispora]|nr:DUF1998 domain-containing protein [Thermomonospora catenispora]